jgi:hypothetical protein
MDVTSKFSYTMKPHFANYVRNITRVPTPRKLEFLTNTEISKNQNNNNRQMYMGKEFIRL